MSQQNSNKDGDVARATPEKANVNKLLSAMSDEELGRLAMNIVCRLATTERFIGAGSFESLRLEAQTLLPHLLKVSTMPRP